MHLKHLFILNFIVFVEKVQINDRKNTRSHINFCCFIEWTIKMLYLLIDNKTILMQVDKSKKLEV